MISSIENKKINILLFTFIILYPWYLVIPGIDMTDAGYMLVNYQNLFDNPSTYANTVALWLTLLFGAVTNAILGGMGLFGFKIANIATIYLSLLLVYSILRAYATSTVLLLGLSTALVFVNIETSSIIDYNTLTILFYLLAAYFLYFALTENKKNYFFIAGIVLGLNIFVRLPNLLGIGLVIVIFYYDFAVENVIKDSLKKSAYVLLGYIFAIVGILMLMKTLGHFELYIEGLNALLSSAKDPLDDYSGSGLLKNLVEDQFYAFMYGFIFMAIILFLSWLSRFWNYSKITMWSSTFVFSFLSMIAIMKISNFFNSPNYYYLHVGIIGIAYWTLILIIFKNFRKNQKFSAIAFIALLIIELLPLGSDTHLLNSTSGLYLGLPIILIYLYSLSSIKIGSFFLDKKEISFLKIFITMTLILFSVTVSTVYFAAYGDSRAKWKMLSTVDHPMLRYNLTTKERSIVLTEVLKNIQKYTKNYDFMLAYNRISTIQYATKTRPYLSNNTPYYYMPHILKQELKKASKEKSLPLVVRARANTGNKDWPQGSPGFHGWQNKGDRAEKRKIIQDFLDSNSYIVVWKNIAFEILIPNQKGK